MTAFVLSWLPCKLLFGKPIFAQILPGGVRLLDQCDFLGAGPAFELLFAGDGGAGAAVLLKPDEAIAIVGGRESFVEFAFVGEDAALQIAGHADVEGVAAAGYDVGVIELFVHGY